MSALASAIPRPQRRGRGRQIDAEALKRSAGETKPVLLASEGRAFTPASIAKAAEVAGPDGTVVVLVITRVYGSGFGLPNPGLLPTHAEREQCKAHAEKAVKALKRRGLKATAEVAGTRHATKRICRLADALGAAAIVMGSDPDRSRISGGMLWSQEPQRVQRHAKLPVHLTGD